MDFRQLLEGNCGEVNPIAQLATHANHGQPFTTNQMLPEHMNVPNTFNMNELMNQLQNLESPRTVSRLAGPRPSSSAMYNHIATQQENLVFDNFFSAEEQTNNFQQNVYLPNNAVPPYLHDVNHEFHPQSEQSSLLKAEEWERLQKEIADAQEIFHNLEDYEEIMEEHNIEDTKLEAGNSNDKVEHPSYLVYKNLSVEDVYGINDLGINFNETEHFYNFVENYVLKNSSTKYQKYRPSKAVGRVGLLCDTNKIKSPRLLESSENSRLYEIPIQQNFGENDFLRYLIEDLAMNEQYSDTIEMGNFNTRDFTCKRNKKYLFLLTDAYLHEHCFYQAGQTLLNWLKSKREYRDIIPPNFVMEDKNETTLDIEQRKALTKMFIKAAQRCPVNPDVKVQFALAKLCEIGQDYEKSIDCFTCIYRNASGWKDSMLMYLGNSFALTNKDESAMEVFQHVSLYKRLNIQARTKIGLIHLKNGHYSEATEQFYGIVNELTRLEYDVQDAALENAWLRLRLCFELMNRGDLCEAVDNRDIIKIEEHISTL